MNKQEQELEAADRAFTIAKKGLTSFMAAHAKLFAQFEEFIDAYNEAHKDMDTLTKTYGIPYGEFKKHATRVSIDADKLADAVGTKAFKKAGGTMEKITKFTIKKEDISLAIARGDLDKSLVDKFVKTTVSFKKPPVLKIK